MRYIKRPDGKFNGSIGDGRDRTPVSAHTLLTPEQDATDTVDLSAAVARLRTPDPLHQLQANLHAHGLPDRDVRAVLAKVSAELDSDGQFCTTPDAWDPTPPEAVNMLRHGHLDAYEALTQGVDDSARYARIRALLTDLELAHPDSAEPVLAFLEQVTVTRDGKATQGDLEPVITDGMLAQHGHVFLATVDDDFVVRPGLPVTVADLREFLHAHREDRTLRTLEELTLATYLKGPASLHRRAWALQHDALARDILTRSITMDDLAVYQALALTYSGGVSQDADFDTVWEPAVSHDTVLPEVRDWVTAHGFTGADDTFGSWVLTGA